MNATGTSATGSERKRRGAVADFLVRLWREKPLGTASGIIILLLIVVAIFADVLSPYPYWEVHPADMLLGSSARYLLGTDQLGRDFLSRIMYGARLSLLVGLSATTINVVVAVLIGGTSGYIGGKLDLVVQRFVDAWMAFPGLLILLSVMSIAGKGLLQIILVLGISGGIGGSRVTRGAVIAVKENAYFQAAHAIGASQWTVLIRHVLPNIGSGNHPVQHQHRRGDHCRIFIELPGIRPARPDSELGRYAQPGRAGVHGDRAVAGSLAWPVPDGYRLQPEHVRRRSQGPARPAAPGRRNHARGWWSSARFESRQVARQRAACTASRYR